MVVKTSGFLSLNALNVLSVMPKYAQQESAQRLNYEQANDNNPAPSIAFRCGARETNLDLSATGGNTTCMGGRRLDAGGCRAYYYPT
jgi:hypothetical protein|tara:strand:- start:739 stop:999 length:261 start_codon:yes stop_codon:yes gene_type:complete